MPTKEYRFECPKCDSKLTLVSSGEKPEKQFCGSCGTLMNLISENSPFGEKEAEAQEEKSEIEFKFEAEVKPQDFPLDKLPENVKLREQNPKCNAEGHFCALFNNQEACLVPINEKEGKNTAIFELTPCSKNKKKGFEVDV